GESTFDKHESQKQVRTRERSSSLSNELTQVESSKPKKSLHRMNSPAMLRPNSSSKGRSTPLQRRRHSGGFPVALSPMPSAKTLIFRTSEIVRSLPHSAHSS